MFKNIKRLLKILMIKLDGKQVIFQKGSNIDRNSYFEGSNKLGVASWFEGYMGYGSYIGDYSIIKAKVGRFCSIGHKVTVLNGRHPSHEFVSTHPVFFSTRMQNGMSYVNKAKFQEITYADKENRFGCIIGNDVWIGYGATIMGGCKIGDGAIVAAGSLVNKDVKPYSIVAGQPAREIGKRFSDNEIDWLIEFKWWDKPEAWIKEHVDEFESINLFMKNNKQGDT